MACFTGLIYNLPSISLNVFNIKLIRSAIKISCENYLGKLENKMFTTNMDLNDSKDLSDNSLVSKHKRDTGLVGRDRGEGSSNNATGRRENVGERGELSRRDRVRLERRERSRLEKAELKRLRENYPSEPYSENESFNTTSSPQRERVSRNRNRNSSLSEIGGNRDLKGKKIRYINTSGKSVKFGNELDGKSIYELEGKSINSIYELDGNSINELDVTTIGGSVNRSSDNINKRFKSYP
jgi:hypothetical protein